MLFATTLTQSLISFGECYRPMHTRSCCFPSYPAHAGLSCAIVGWHLCLPASSDVCLARLLRKVLEAMPLRYLSSELPAISLDVRPSWRCVANMNAFEVAAFTRLVCWNSVLYTVSRCKNAKQTKKLPRTCPTSFDQPVRGLATSLLSTKVQDRLEHCSTWR
jgi:hypothetical protein